MCTVLIRIRLNKHREKEFERKKAGVFPIQIIKKKARIPAKALKVVSLPSVTPICFYRGSSRQAQNHEDSLSRIDVISFSILI